MSDQALIAALTERRSKHRCVEREWVSQEGLPYTALECPECRDWEWPCEMSLMLDVCIAAERRRLAEDVHNRLSNRTGGMLFASKPDFAEWFRSGDAVTDAKKAEDAALDRLAVQLVGGREEVGT